MVAGLRELSGLQTVLVAVSAVPHQADPLGPHEEERVAVPPGRVGVPAGCRGSSLVPHMAREVSPSCQVEELQAYQENGQHCITLS